MDADQPYEPLILLHPTIVHGMYTHHSPHWRGVILGPVPFGRDERYRLEIEGILCADREAASVVMHEHARSACAEFNHIYDEDEWDVVSMELRGGN